MSFSGNMGNAVQVRSLKYSFLDQKIFLLAFLASNAAFANLCCLSYSSCEIKFTPKSKGMNESSLA